MVSQSTVWHLGRLQLRHDYVMQIRRLQKPSLGLARTTPQTLKDFKTNSLAECTESTTFSLEAQKSSSEQLTHDTLYKKTEAWQIRGTLMIVTSCVTLCWCFPLSKSLTSPTLKLEQSEPPQKTEGPSKLRKVQWPCYQQEQRNGVRRWQSLDWRRFRNFFDTRGGRQPNRGWSKCGYSSLWDGCGHRGQPRGEKGRRSQSVPLHHKHKHNTHHRVSCFLLRFLSFSLSFSCFFHGFFVSFQCVFDSSMLLSFFPCMVRAASPQALPPRR